jgi:predicted TIM-barrel enzyme
MAGRFDRASIVARLRAEREARRPIYDALCGSGITAKMAARGGADLVTTHCLAYFRMQGLSSMAGYLPICDANALTLDLGERSLINVVHEAPLIAGLLCVDPTRDMKHFAREVATLREAARMGLFTKAFCTSPVEALAVAEVGVDNIIVHFGNSSGGTIGSQTVMNRDAAVARATAVLDALSSKYADRIVTCHGGGIETPEDFAGFLEAEPRLDGYVGGSSAERFPIETSVTAAARAFKAVKLAKAR